MFDLKQLLTTPTLHDGCNDQIVILIQDPEGSHGVILKRTPHTHTHFFDGKIPCWMNPECFFRNGD